MNKGVSVIVCCYNSSQTIQATIKYLFGQVVKSEVPWEIVLVNNGSTDNTVELVNTALSTMPSINARLVSESRQGLMYARERGILEARYEFLLFCDDDNMLFDNYVQGVFDILDSDRMIGACGGRGILKLQSGQNAPDWFTSYQHAYAIGSQLNNSGYANQLYGAGICIRKSVMESLFSSGFRSFCTGRKGDLLLGGDDSELTLAIRVHGYKIVAADSLAFYHLIVSKRLNLEYLKKMFRGFGMSYSALYFYYRKLNETKIRSYLILLVGALLRAILFSWDKRLDKQIAREKSIGILLGVISFKFQLAQVPKIIKKINRSRELS